MRRLEVRFTLEAERDLVRLHDHWLQRDLDVAERALSAIRSALGLVAFTPYSCRTAVPGDPFLRELIIPFGSSGSVALFRIERRHLTVLAVRHQHDGDYR